MRRRPVTFTQAPDGTVAVEPTPTPTPRAPPLRLSPGVALGLLGAAAVLVALEPRFGRFLLEQLPHSRD